MGNRLVESWNYGLRTPFQQAAVRWENCGHNEAFDPTRHLEVPRKRAEYL